MCSSAIYPRGSNERAGVTGPAGITLWFTGLSGAGKSTLTAALAKRLREDGEQVVVLDADVLRRGLCKGLGFSREDRAENARRIAGVARNLTETGNVVLVAAITPYSDARRMVRAMIGAYVEVYVEAPLAVCMARDPKGLYAKALRGEVERFTGVSDPYEEPRDPEYVCRTDVMTVEECVALLCEGLARERARVDQYFEVGVEE